VAVNFGAAAVELEGLGGRVLVGTDRARDGEAFPGALAPGEGVVVELA
jgi:hypothetical protein